MCTYHFRHPYTFCVKIYNILTSYYTLKIMLLCGFYWHSRYSIWDFHIYFMRTNSLIRWSRCPPWVLGSGSIFCTVLPMCTYHFRHPYTFCVKIYNILTSYYTLKIMLLCGFYWHSRYSIWDFHIYFMHFCMVYREFLYPISTKCDQISCRLVYIITNSLQIKHSVHIRFIFAYLVISGILVNFQVSHVPNGFIFNGFLH